MPPALVVAAVGAAAGAAVTGGINYVTQSAVAEKSNKIQKDAINKADAQAKADSAARAKENKDAIELQERATALDAQRAQIGTLAALISNKQSSPAPQVIYTPSTQSAASVFDRVNSFLDSIFRG